MAKCSFFESLDPDGKNPKFSLDSEYRFLDVGAEQLSLTTFALLELDHPVLCPPDSLYIASKLDTDIHSNACRLAFHGRLLVAFTEKNYCQRLLPSLRVFKEKQKSGIIERMVDEQTVIAHSLFKKETKVHLFAGLKVELSTGEKGLIEGGFGQSGKAKIRIPSGLTSETVERLGRRKRKETSKNIQVDTTHMEPVTVYLKYKRYIYDQSKRMVQ